MDATLETRVQASPGSSDIVVIQDASPPRLGVATLLGVRTSPRGVKRKISPLKGVKVLAQRL